MFMRSGYSAQTRRTPSATEHHHRRAEVRARLGDLAARLGAQPGDHALALELAGRQRGERDRVLLAVARAVGGHAEADALEDDRAAALADGDRIGEIAPAVVLADIRRQGVVGIGLERG